MFKYFRVQWHYACKTGLREKDEEIIQLYNKLLMCRQSKIRAKS